jgi:hypothetical protein
MTKPGENGGQVRAMRRRSGILLGLLLTAVLAAGAARKHPPAALSAPARRAESAGAQPRPAAQEQAAQEETFAGKDDTRPASEVYKNIQIFKATPANQVLGIMKYFTRALGVRCEHCHVTSPGNKIPGFGAFSRDDMEAKKRARKMLEMVGEINPKYFSEAKKGPTCWTCHRGSTKPEIDPPPPPAAPGE